MPLLLPFFKFDVQAWLTSETVSLMKNEQRGGFITLLSKCWANLTCTLPNDRDQCKQLADWDGTEDNFETVWACFKPVKSMPNRVFNVRLMKEWKAAKVAQAFYAERAQLGAKARWADKPGVRKKRTTAPAQPVDWMAALKAMPIYAHVNWERELGKIAEWKSRPENKHRIVNQKFMANWVNKIEPPLTNGHAGHPIRCMICEKDYPDHGALKTHNVIYHPKYEG